MRRTPAQVAQAKRINPYVPRRHPRPAGPTESWWIGLSEAEFYAEAAKRHQQWLERVGRVVYPNREDVA